MRDGFGQIDHCSFRGIKGQHDRGISPLSVKAGHADDPSATASMEMPDGAFAQFDRREELDRHYTRPDRR
jgi:hypothetical protein